MGIFSMLMRSILSYTVFLASRKIVRGGTGIGEGIKKNLRLHRCHTCWRLYSGEILRCSFCGEQVEPLYRVYKEDDYGPYERTEDFEKREGLERQIYNDSRHLKFEPLKAPRLEVTDDRNRRRTDPESSGRYKGRDSNSSRHVNDDRGEGRSDRSRDTELGKKPRRMA